MKGKKVQRMELSLVQAGWGRKGGQDITDIGKESRSGGVIVLVWVGQRSREERRSGERVRSGGCWSLRFKLLCFPHSVKTAVSTQPSG
jgi:hypothetical protein